MTYGQIGQILDLNPRVVGWALNRLAKVNRISCIAAPQSGAPAPTRVERGESLAHSGRVYRKKAHIKYERRTTIHEHRVPWQRVINSKGGISTNKLMNIPLDLQKKLLEKEGVVFSKEEKIDLKKYLWRSDVKFVVSS